MSSGTCWQQRGGGGRRGAENRRGAEHTVDQYGRSWEERLGRAGVGGAGGLE